MSVDRDEVISEFKRLINNFGNSFFFSFSLSFFSSERWKILRRNFDPLKIEMINDALD